MLLPPRDEPIETFDHAHLKSTCLALIEDPSIEVSDRLAWLQVFDADDLQEIVELLDSGSDELDDLIHEWHESALVIESGVLDGFDF